MNSLREFRIGNRTNTHGGCYPATVKTYKSASAMAAMEEFISDHYTRRPVQSTLWCEFPNNTFGHYIVGHVDLIYTNDTDTEQAVPDKKPERKRLEPLWNGQVTDRGDFVRITDSTRFNTYDVPKLRTWLGEWMLAKKNE